MTHPEALAVIEAACATIPREDLPALIGDLERVSATAMARLMTPEIIDDKLLDAEAAAELLGMSRDRLYGKAGDFPFTVRLGGRVRFSRAGILRFIARRQGR